MPVSFLFKWLFIPLVWFGTTEAGNRHPIYMSVTEIEYNTKERSVEVSCKIFTDDFEKALRNAYKAHIDLQDEKIKPAMDKFVDEYVQKHLQIAADGKPVLLKYLGYEIIEEGVYSYYRGDNISSVKKLAVKNDILFEYKKEQMNLLHVTVDGKRKSTKLDNPESNAVLEF